MSYNPHPLFPGNCSCMTKSSRKKEKLSKFAKCREGFMITSNSSSQISFLLRIEISQTCKPIEKVVILYNC